MQRRVGMEGSKYANVGVDVSDCLIDWNAVSNSSDHTIFFVLRSGRRGVRRLAIVAVVDESWLTNPTNERRSVRLVGVGKFVIASMMDGSTW